MPDRTATGVLLHEMTQERRERKAVALTAVNNQIGYLLRRIPAPALGNVERHDSDRIIVLAVEEIDDQCGQVSLAIVGLAP